MKFETTLTALVQIKSAENKVLYYMEYSNYYELLIIVSPLLFYSNIKKQTSAANTFETTYKAAAIKLN